VPSGSETRGWVHFDQSRRAVRQALNEAVKIARAIEKANASEAPLDEHLAIFERIRVFASRYGVLWGVAIPDPLPLRIDDRKIDGSMLQWYLELLTLLDVYELLPVASGEREDRKLHTRVRREKGDKVAVFTSKGREDFRLASRDQTITIQPPWEAKPQVVEPWQLVHGKSEVLAWVILTTICKAKLDHRINIGLHPSEKNSLAITPDGIIPTLFARLWLYSLRKDTNRDMVRLCQHPGCENTIPPGAYANKLYCGDTCQKADRRRLIRLEQAQP
jgi:hypothetical protein